MSRYESVIEKMNRLVNQYHTMRELNGEELNNILAKMSSSLYFMETVRSDVHDQWQKRVKELIDSGNSVSRSENQAHAEIPDMYRLRRIMDAGYEVVGAIRSNISWLKSEIHITQ